MPRTTAAGRKSLIYFTPTQLSGLVAWFKADSIGAGDGSAVSTWSDSSGNANDATNGGAAGTKPTYKTNIVNGQPVVRFDGGDGLIVANQANFNIATYTAFIVATYTSGTGAIMAKNVLVANTTRRKLQFSFSNTTTFTTSSGNDGTQFNTTISNATTPGIYVYTTTGDSAHIVTKNGTDTASTTTLNESSGNFNSSPLLIGSAFGIGTEGYVGDIAEIIIYNVPLAASERLGVQNYLADKYGITNSVINIGSTATRTTASFRQIIPNTPTCLAFSGSSQAVTWASGLYNYTDKITLMGCFLFVDTTNFSNYPTFWSIGDNGGAFLIMNAPGTIGMHVKITTEKATNTVGALSGTGKFKFNQFYWIAGSYDSTVGSNNLNIYIFDLLGNLIETATSTQSGTITYTSTSPVLAWSYVRGYYMKMRASRLLVANAAFTQAEMQTFIRTEALSTANAAVTTYWPLADGSGSTAVPKIGTGNGTLTGSPTWTSAVPIPNRTVVT